MHHNGMKQDEESESSTQDLENKIKMTRVDDPSRGEKCPFGDIVNSVHATIRCASYRTYSNSYLSTNNRKIRKEKQKKIANQFKLVLRGGDAVDEDLNPAKCYAFRFQHMLTDVDCNETEIWRNTTRFSLVGLYTLREDLEQDPPTQSTGRETRITNMHTNKYCPQ